MATDTYAAKAGIAASVGSSPWATAQAKKKDIPWLPPPNTPLYPGGPPLGRTYWLFLREIALRLDGIYGKPIAEINGSIVSIQDAVNLVQVVAQEAQASAIANANAIDVIKDVAEGNSLTGWENIP